MALLSALLTACGSDPAPESTNHESPWLVLLDTVLLQETDDVYVGQAGGLAAGPDGTYLISDQRTRRVHHFAGDGTYLRSIGFPGSGPGEFSAAPGFMALDGDSLLFVSDGNLLHVFDYASSEPIEVMQKSGFVEPLAARRGSVIVNLVDRTEKTTLGIVPRSVSVIRRGETAIRWGGPFPHLLGRSHLIDQYFAFMQVAVLGGDTIAVALQSADYLFWGPFDGPFDSIPVPPRRRRGSRPDLLEKITDDPRTGEPALYQLSLPWGLTRLSNGSFAYVVTDQDLVSQRTVGRLFLSVVDPERQRACLDAEIPVPPDPQPRVAFSKDTVLVFMQDIQEDGTDGGRPIAVMRKYGLTYKTCP